MDSTHDRQFVDNHPDLVVETVSSDNAKNYQIVLDSVQHMNKYSNNVENENNITNEVIKPLIPNKGNLNSNCIFGIYEALTNEAVGLIHYYIEYDNKPFVLIQTLCIRKEYQNKGYGSAIIEHFIKIWKNDRMEKVLVNIDFRNIHGIRFLVNNGFNQIDKVISNEKFSENTFCGLRLFRYID